MDIIILFHFESDLPQAALSLGPNFDANKIKEGDDVYFECRIEAKPVIYKTSWWFNVSWLNNVGKLDGRGMVNQFCSANVYWPVSSKQSNKVLGSTQLRNHNLKLDQFVARFSLGRKLLHQNHRRDFVLKRLNSGRRAEAECSRGSDHGEQEPGPAEPHHRELRPLRLSGDQLRRKRPV